MEIVDEFPQRITGLSARLAAEDRSLYTDLGSGGRATGQRTFVNEMSLVVAKQWIPRFAQA